MNKHSKKRSPIVATEKTADEIRFYRANEKPYGPFSNLYKSSITFEGRVFPTAEHAYQAGKAQKEKVREWILAAPSPSLAAMAAHGLYTWDIVPNWNDIKFDRMRAVLLAKFTQHPELLTLLLSTGNKRLVEAGTTNNAVNRLWGEVNGVGQNMLGKMLMDLRAKLGNEANKAEKKPGPKATTATQNKKTSVTRRAKVA